MAKSELTLSKWLEIGRSILNDPGRTCADAIAELPVLSKMIREKFRFDAVIGLPTGMSSCPGYVAHLFDSKIIQFSPTGPWPLHMKATGVVAISFYFIFIFLFFNLFQLLFQSFVTTN